MKEFNPYSFDYKEYVKEEYGLNEMPNRWNNQSFTLDDPRLNSNEAIWVEENAKRVGNFPNLKKSLSFRLYLHTSGNENTYYLLNHQKPFIHAEYSFNKINDGVINGIENKYMWNYKWDKGLVRMFFDEFIINEHPLIVSDETQTERGFNFWKYLFIKYVKQEEYHVMNVYDINKKVYIKKLEQEEDLDRFFKDTGMSKYRFVLKKI